MPLKRLEKEDYTVGWICALSIPELKASRLLFDGEEHEDVVLDRRTIHQYVYGEIHGHNVVMGCLPASQMGKASAAGVANEMFTTFTGLHFALIVGVGGAVPMPNDIRLGDVVVSLPDLNRQHGGVVQYDFGKALHDGRFVKTGQLNQPSNTVLSGLGKLRSAPERSSHLGQYLQLYQEDSYWDRGESDHLFTADYHHAEGQPTCSKCDLERKEIRSDRPTSAPRVHYGLIASGDQVMKDATKRDALSQQYGGILCFEMEAAGIMNILPCLNVRGICDYCDSHKNKSWQPFAAAAAAAWAKELLRNIAPTRSAGSDIVRLQDVLKTAQDLWLERFVSQLTTSKRSVGDVQELIGRMSLYEPRRILKRIGLKKHPGTTEWLTTHPAFARWVSKGTPSRILWLSGKVGSGKTIAMSTAVDFLEDKAHSGGRIKILHYFFQYPETRAIDLFRSLSRQLIQIYIDNDMVCSSELVNHLDLHFGACNRRPDLADIVEDILLPLTKAFPMLVVCVDGIDMCDEHELDLAWLGLRKLCEQRTQQEKNTRTLVTGANESKLATLLPEDTLRVSLDQGINVQDMEKYIDARLEEQAHPRQLFYDTELRAAVRRALLQRAENMFLWVHLQLEEIIHNCDTPSEVKATLKNLPKSLQDLYMRCMGRKSNGKLLCNPKLLKWCSAARKPLGVDSVRDMLALDRGSGEIERSKRPKLESLLRSGVSLLTLIEPEMLLEPAHHTVRQFIFSDLLYDSLASGTEIPPAVQDELNIRLEDTTSEIGQLSLLHIEAKIRTEIVIPRAVKAPPVIGMIPQLVQRGLRLGRQKTVAPEFYTQRPTQPSTSSFLKYAVDTWTLHTHSFIKSTSSWHKFERVALQPNASWNLHPWPAVGNTHTSHLRGLLGYAVVHNHQPLLQLLVDQPTLLPKAVYNEVLPGNDLLPPLHVAASLGHLKLLPMLLKLCSVNSVCPQHGQTALHVALAHGQEEFVAALCGVRDARLDILDAHGVSPFAWAFRNSQVDTLRVLLNSGKIDINSPGNGLLPHERQDCLELHGILLGIMNVNSRDSNHETMLHRAAFEKNEQKVKLLIACGADVDATNGHTKTPLYQAAYTGNEAIVKLLLASQADVHKHTRYGETPLDKAAARGHRAVVEMLLVNGADPVAKLHYNPLYWAAANGHHAVVESLIAHGADPDAKIDVIQCTALYQAAANGHYEVVKVLLAHGADPNTKVGCTSITPLHKAAADGSAAVVDLLLANGADPNARTKSSHHLLDEADAKWHEAQVSPSVVVREGWYGPQHTGGQTPLHYAAFNGHEDTIARLLAPIKTDVNAMDDQGRTPLHYAAARGHAGIIRELLESGNARVD